MTFSQSRYVSELQRVPMMSSASTGELPVPRNTGKQGNRHETVKGKDFIRKRISEMKVIATEEEIHELEKIFILS